MVTHFGTGMMSNGYAATYGAFSGNAGYETQYSEGDDYSYALFGQSSETGGNLDYAMESGVASLGSGSVGMTSYYYPLNSIDAWGFGQMNTSNGIVWINIDSSRSLVESAYYFEDFMSWLAFIQNTGQTSSRITVSADENMAFNAVADINGDMHYEMSVENMVN
jgi:hypothetical protein